MGKVRIEMPQHVDFVTEMPIRASDIRGDHMGAVTIMPIAVDVQLMFMQHLGINRFSTRGDWFIVADTAMIFKSQGRFGHSLRIEVAVAEFEQKSCEFIYRFSCKETGEEIALVKMGIVFFNYKTQKAIDVPPEFRKHFPQ